MALNIQYPYALDEHGGLRHIDTVDKQSRSEHVFYCPNCGKEMRACLGDKNAHYFSHECGCHCSTESYIHKTAKSILLKRYNDSTSAFIIGLRVKRKCKQFEVCENVNSKCELSPIYQEYSLKHHYDLPAVMEESYISEAGEFTPDLMLRSSNIARKPIFIEIFYKHKSSDKKLASGNYIIEFEIKSFTDLQNLERVEVFEESEYIKFYNFKTLMMSSDIIEQEIRRECFDNEAQISEYDLPFCKQSNKVQRTNLALRRLVIYKSGKCYEGGIFESEKVLHKPNALIDITYTQSPKMMDFSPLFVIAKKFSWMKSCYMCEHCVSTEDVTWCKNVKNGSSRKGTFNEQKARLCKCFQWSEYQSHLYSIYMKELIEGEDYIIWTNPNEKFD